MFCYCVSLQWAQVCTRQIYQGMLSKRDALVRLTSSLRLLVLSKKKVIFYIKTSRPKTSKYKEVKGSEPPPSVRFPWIQLTHLSHFLSQFLSSIRSPFPYFSLRLSVCLSLCRSVSLSLSHPLSLYQFVRLFHLSLSHSLSFHSSLSVFITPYFCLCLSIYLSRSHSLCLSQIFTTSLWPFSVDSLSLSHSLSLILSLSFSRSPSLSLSLSPLSLPHFQPITFSSPSLLCQPFSLSLSLSLPHILGESIVLLASNLYSLISAFIIFKIPKHPNSGSGFGFTHCNLITRGRFYKTFRGVYYY